MRDHLSLVVPTYGLRPWFEHRVLLLRFLAHDGALTSRCCIKGCGGFFYITTPGSTTFSQRLRHLTRGLKENGHYWLHYEGRKPTCADVAWGLSIPLRSDAMPKQRLRHDRLPYNSDSTITSICGFKSSSTMRPVM